MPEQINWNVQSASLNPQQIASIRGAIQTVNPWQSLISCVDGRPLENDGDYVQALGGTLQSVLWIQFCAWRNGDQITFAEAFDRNNTLHHVSHLRIGIHSGPHAAVEKGKTDCGFADNLTAILAALGNNAAAIQALLNNGARQNGHHNIIDHHNEAVWESVTSIARELIYKAKSNKTYKIMKSTEMFKVEEELAGTYAKEPLIGEHQEQFAHVNLASGTSTNTVRLNDMGLAGFNLDLWYALEQVAQAKAFQELGCDGEFIKLLTLGLYQATERVLRPDKPPLPIIITEDSDLT